VDGLQYHSNIMVFFGYSWSLENYLQAIERIGPTRQLQAGFKRPVFMHLIMAADTLDEVVIERLHSKREVQDVLMQAMKERGFKTLEDAA
jgi:SNF2 family DNA or RNA helicase